MNTPFSMWRTWAPMLVLGIVGAAAVGGWACSRPTQYTTSAAVMVVPAAPPKGSETNASVLASIPHQIHSFAKMVPTQRVLDPARAAAGFEDSVGGLKEHLRVEVPPESSIISVTATFPHPGEAARLTNAVIDSLGKQIPQVGPRYQGGAAMLKTEVLQRATQETRVGPGASALMMTVAGGAVGSAAGWTLGKQLSRRSRDASAAADTESG